MVSPKLCPACHAKTLERQNKNVYLPTATIYGSPAPPSLKVKPWVCSHCGVVLLYKVEES